MNAILKPLDAATLFAQCNARQYRNVTLHLAPGAAWNPATSLGGPYTKPDGNAAGFAADEWTQIVSSVQTEPDPAKQKQLFDQLNDYMLDQAFFVVVGYTPSAWVAHTKVHDVSVNAFPVGPYDRAWLA